MFNDQYRLTEAVLEGRKTQTRRIIKCPREFKGELVAGFNIHIRKSDKKVVDWPCMYDADEREFDGGEILPRYNEGEIVAIAQSYADIGIEPFPFCEAGWRNKMRVKADLMPHQIKVTNIRIQRLQDISDEDCLAEGVGLSKTDNRIGHPFAISFNYYIKEDTKANRYTTAREAYAALLDKVSGKGTWESNPWVFVYEFELIK